MIWKESLRKVVGKLGAGSIGAPQVEQPHSGQARKDF